MHFSGCGGVEMKMTVMKGFVGRGRVVECDFCALIDTQSAKSVFCRLADSILHNNLQFEFAMFWKCTVLLLWKGSILRIW
jgi:hypothetical protein